ncbi:DUF7338 family protein [Rhizobium leguminosarum]
MLQWFSTPDADIASGVRKDRGISGRSPQPLWWQRTCWICRNPAHG